MRLCSLELTNFRVIRRARIEFTDSVTGVIGPNGAGKSTIVEAVAWALYGNPAARSGKNEIKSTLAAGGEDCEANLTFEIRDVQYRIVRRLAGKTEKPEVLLYRNGTQESVGSAVTGQQVAALIGLDWRGFLTSFLARQQELNALADLAPAQRRDHLAGMLGIGVLDKALQRVKDDARAMSQQVEFLNRQADRLTVLGDELRAAGEHAEIIAKQHAAASGAYEAAKAKLAVSAAQYREHQVKQAMCSRLSGQREGLLATLNHLQGQLNADRQTVGDLTQTGVELQAAEAALRDYDALKLERESLVTVRQQQTLRADLESQRRQVGSERHQVLAQAKHVWERVEVCRQRLAGLPEVNADLLEQAKKRLDQLRSEWTEARMKVELNAKELQKVTVQLADMRHLGPEAVCDRCLRPFGGDLHGIRGHLESEAAALESQALEARTSLSQKQAEGESQKAAVDVLEGALRARRDNETLIESSARERQGLEERLVALGDRFAQLDARLSDLPVTKCDETRLGWLSAEIARLDGVRARFHELQGRLAALPEIEQRIQTELQKTASLCAEIQGLEEALAAQDFDESRFAAVRQEYEARVSDHDVSKEALTRVERDRELKRQEIDLKTTELARLQSAQAELDNLRTAQFYAEKLAGLFAGFRKHTISRIRPRLAELTSELLAQMTGGRYSLVELDPDYNIHVMDFGAYFGVERFSGGERDLASLCLRLAISQALTESAGLDRSFIILDEVFGSQDTGRRDLIFEALATLKARFPQILLITHIEELKHKVETLIEVVPTGSGWSEVRVDGVVC